MAEHDYYADSDDLHYMPSVPTSRSGFRDTYFVRNIMLRMGSEYVAILDKLCQVNDRTRREIVEILICEAMHDYENDKKTSRIDPF